MKTLHEAAHDGWVMVPREPTQAMCAAAVVFANGNAVYKNVLPEVLKLEEEIYGEVWSAMIAASPAAPVVREPQPEPVQRLMRFAGKKRSEVSNPCLTAREAIVIADWMQAHGIGTTGGSHV